MSQSVVMIIDPQPKLLQVIQEDLQRYRQKLEILYANSSQETLKQLKDSRSRRDTLTLLVVEQKPSRIEDADLLQLVKEMFPKVQRFMLKVYDSDEPPSCIPVPTAFVVCTNESETNELETALSDLQLLAHKS